MAETARSWAPRGAWAGIAQAGQIGAAGQAGIIATLLDGFGLATLIVAPGGTSALSQAVEARLGIALPTAPKIVSSASHDAIWSGPELEKRHFPPTPVGSAVCGLRVAFASTKAARIASMSRTSRNQPSGDGRCPT